MSTFAIGFAVGFVACPILAFTLTCSVMIVADARRGERIFTRAYWAGGGPMS